MTYNLLYYNLETYNFEQVIIVYRYCITTCNTAKKNTALIILITSDIIMNGIVGTMSTH